MSPNGRDSARSAESTSIPVADLAASKDMEISASVSDGSIAMSSGARGGGRGGAEVVEERCEGAVASGRIVGVATVGATTSSMI